MEAGFDSNGNVNHRKAPAVDPNVYASAWVRDKGLDCTPAYQGATGCTPQDGLASAAYANAYAFYNASHALVGYTPDTPCFTCAAANAQADSALALADKIIESMFVQPFIDCAHGESTGCAMAALMGIPAFGEMGVSGKVAYGSTDMAAMAKAFRLNPGEGLAPLSVYRNFAVFEYMTENGPVYVIAANVPGDMHSEAVINNFLKANNMDRNFVTRIYSERVPCNKCSTKILNSPDYAKVAITLTFNGSLMSAETAQQLMWLLPQS